MNLVQIHTFINLSLPSMKNLFFKFIQFSLVGLLGMVIDFGITAFCKEILKWQKYVANSCGFTLAVCSNYLLNRYWTFKSSNASLSQEFLSFLAISIIGLFINNLVIWLCIQKGKISFYFAKVIAIGVTVMWNFFCNYFLTFNQAFIN